MLIDKYCFRFHNVYFSPGHDIKKNISKLILEAESNIDLCVFTISDPHLSKNLLYCAGKGIKIRIITDDYKTMARGSMVRNLAQNGILVKTDNSKSLMHNKFGIIDQRIAITGSFNWTLTATLHNQENILATSNVDIVNQYQAQFNRLWEKMFDLSLSD
jgi:phosphatidylserine/phosphatidylglycerophosphate/cardiolipin synthase-like enzyme